MTDYYGDGPNFLFIKSSNTLPMVKKITDLLRRCLEEETDNKCNSLQ